FLSVLLYDHASRSSLIHGLADVLVKAAEINFLDKELMGLLSRIVSKVKWPEDLPAFQDGVLPSGTAWPQYSLKRIYEEKSGAYQDFLNSAYFLVMPAIVAGTEELKKKKKNLESVVKAMEGCITLIGMMKKMLCIVS
ncbi:MAG: hypothetical protein HGA72_09855, partial [Chlorobiaceae bacterium]|nr:hypothetical protein [Chlorobiaceae bacterium]